MNQESLTLLVFSGCPFCDKVTDFMKENNISIPIIDIMTDEKTREKLYEETKSMQVPCLDINGSYMRESDDIIEYLRKTI